MRITNVKILSRLIFAAIVCVGGVAIASAQTTPMVNVPNGSTLEIKGFITSRSGDSLMMRDLTNTGMYFVELTPSTDVKTHRSGVFGGHKEFPTSYLLRGLRIEVKGNGNADGHLVANKIQFDMDDLRTAQALQVSLDPVEARVDENTENAKRMAGQIEENAAAAAAAQASANKAQGTADEAMASAERANNRINGLGEYDSIKTIVVPFATGSSTIGPKGRAIIEEAAAWVKTQDRRGWMVEIVGFADSTGNTKANKALSERRANAVIGYLVSKHNMPLTRLVQPFGAGVDNPAATNETAEGRAQNRRVEIRLLKNKGIAGD